MDTFVESSWYFERFACADYDRGMMDPGVWITGCP